MLVTLAGMLMEVIEVPANAYSPMLVTPDGITTEPAQPSFEIKALLEIVAVPEVQSIVPFWPS
jgi:hypothetical protein